MADPERSAKKKMLAIIIDDSPKPEPLFLLLAYLPALVISISWLLIRWKKWLGAVALVIGAFAAYLIVAQLKINIVRLDAMQRVRPDLHIEPLFREYIVAAWFGALFPFVMVALFFFLEQKKPNKPPQTTTGSSAPSRV